ncbi:hypothetical protein DL93DRAFT_925941 [Clavulina sp. PMI_390]|nr:hypothetical protein DL93DRAFT_925941 [Clavulina sp. PMI_390]
MNPLLPYLQPKPPVFCVSSSVPRTGTPPLSLCLSPTMSTTSSSSYTRDLLLEADVDFQYTNFLYNNVVRKTGFNIWFDCRRIDDHQNGTRVWEALLFGEFFSWMWDSPLVWRHVLMNIIGSGWCTTISRLGPKERMG